MLHLMKPAQERGAPGGMSALTFPLLLILALFLICECAWLVFLGPTPDVNRYQCYALAFWRGGQSASALPAGQCAFLGAALHQAAFHVTPLEYPPLALLPFSTPLLAPPPYYAFTFALSMTIVVGLIAWLLGAFHSRRAMARYLFLLVIGAWALFQLRYDLLPAACMLGCLIAAERKRWRLAYSALAVATLLKLYPAVALPALFIAERHAWAASAPLLRPHLKPQRRAPGEWWRGLALYCGALLGAQGVVAALGAPGALLQPVVYLLQRPLQVESMQSSVAWLAHLAGAPLRVVSTYGSLNVVTPLDQAIGWVGAGLYIAGWLYVFWLQWRGRLSLGQAMIALLCMLIITEKVFSPQFLLWVIPLIAYVGASGRWLSWWASVSLLTMGVYVAYYGQLTDAATAARVLPTLPGFFAVVAVRNVAFLLLTLAYLFNWRQARHDPSLKGLPSDLTAAP